MVREYKGWDNWINPPQTRKTLSREDFDALLDAWHDDLFKHYYGTGERDWKNTQMTGYHRDTNPDCICECKACLWNYPHGLNPIGEKPHQDLKTSFDNELPGKRLAQFIIRNWTRDRLDEKTAREFIDETISTFGQSIFDLIARRDRWEDWKSERNIRDKPKSQTIADPARGYTKCSQCRHLNLYHHPNWTIFTERTQFNGWNCDICGKVCTDHLGIPSTLRLNDSFKDKKFISIEKDIWEDIKVQASKLNRDYSCNSYTTDNLVKSIQKVDKEFCPND